MGCGIVSIDLHSADQRGLSDALLWFAVVLWLVLCLRVASSPGRAFREAASPAVLSSVAGTAVLGVRFAVRDDALIAVAALLLAAIGLATLMPAVIAHWETPTTGTSFLLSVATQSLAALGATVAVTYQAGWLLGLAGLSFLAGLVLYVVVAWRFRLGTIGSAAGDHWVAGGALAIAALAAGKLTSSAVALGLVSGWHDGLADLALAIWCAAMAWLVPLVVSEIIRPRFRYDVRRWATVFPVGMYAACSFAVGPVTGIGGIADFARAWTWVAVVVTAVVLGGLARRALSNYFAAGLLRNMRWPRK